MNEYVNAAIAADIVSAGHKLYPSIFADAKIFESEIFDPLTKTRLTLIHLSAEDCPLTIHVYSPDEIAVYAAHIEAETDYGFEVEVSKLDIENQFFGYSGSISIGASALVCQMMTDTLEYLRGLVIPRRNFFSKVDDAFKSEVGKRIGTYYPLSELNPRYGDTRKMSITLNRWVEDEDGDTVLSDKEADLYDVYIRFKCMDATPEIAILEYNPKQNVPPSDMYWKTDENITLDTDARDVLTHIYNKICLKRLGEAIVELFPNEWYNITDRYIFLQNDKYRVKIDFDNVEHAIVFDTAQISISGRITYTDLEMSDEDWTYEYWSKFSTLLNDDDIPDEIPQAFADAIGVVYKQRSFVNLIMKCQDPMTWHDVEFYI